MQTQLDVSESVIDGSKFLKVMLKDCLFQDVMITGAQVKDANLRTWRSRGLKWDAFIGMPPKGHPFYDPKAEMRPLKFEDCNLEGCVIENCNLTGVELKDCNIKGLKIDGIDISQLLDEYRKK